jgi:hypothetical protein
MNDNEEPNYPASGGGSVPHAGQGRDKKGLSFRDRVIVAIVALALNLLIEFGHRPPWAYWWSVFAIAAFSVAVLLGRRSERYWCCMGLGMGSGIGVLLDILVFRH